MMREFRQTATRQMDVNSYYLNSQLFDSPIGITESDGGQLDYLSGFHYFNGNENKTSALLNALSFFTLITGGRE
jgi:hypothetical protein